MLALGAHPVELADLEELAAVAFDEQAGHIDRLRAQAVAVPSALLESAVAGLAEPLGARNPLRVAEAIARLGGRPANPVSVEEHEDAILARIEGASTA